MTRFTAGPALYLFHYQSLKFAVDVAKAARTLEDRLSAQEDLGQFLVDMQMAVPSPDVPTHFIADANDVMKAARFEQERLAGLIINMVEERDYPRKALTDAVPMDGTSFMFTIARTSAL